MRNPSKIAVLAIALTTLGTTAYAAGEKGNDALSVTQAKVSLTQAVNTAIQHTPGTASRAEYEGSKEGWVYDIEIVDGKKVFDVKVDAQDGSVLSSEKDKADHDDEDDERD
nr:PepSY domain-containing protein [uncultured Halomonas sp.]